MFPVQRLLLYRNCQFLRYGIYSLRGSILRVLLCAAWVLVSSGTPFGIECVLKSFASANCNYSIGNMATHAIRDNTNFSQVRYRFLAGKIPGGTRTVDEAGLNCYSERIRRPDFFQRKGKIEKATGSLSDALGPQGGERTCGLVNHRGNPKSGSVFSSLVSCIVCEEKIFATDPRLPQPPRRASTPHPPIKGIWPGLIRSLMIRYGHRLFQKDFVTSKERETHPCKLKHDELKVRKKEEQKKPPV